MQPYKIASRGGRTRAMSGIASKVSAKTCDAGHKAGQEPENIEIEKLKHDGLSNSFSGKQVTVSWF